MKNFNFKKPTIYLLVSILLLPIFIKSDAALGGVLDFFLSVLTEFGKWVGTTVIGGTIENTIDFLASFFNQNMIKADYWGSLTGFGHSQLFKATKNGISYMCSTPEPTRYYRGSVNSRWLVDPLTKEFLADCYRDMFQLKGTP